MRASTFSEDQLRVSPLMCVWFTSCACTAFRTPCRCSVLTIKGVESECGSWSLRVPTRFQETDRQIESCACKLNTCFVSSDGESIFFVELEIKDLLSCEKSRCYANTWFCGFPTSRFRTNSLQLTMHDSDLLEVTFRPFLHSIASNAHHGMFTPWALGFRKRVSACMLDDTVPCCSSGGIWRRRLANRVAFVKSTHLLLWSNKATYFENDLKLSLLSLSLDKS